MKKKKIIKYLKLGILVFLCLGVVFTKSRGGFIGFIAIALGVIFYSKNRKKTIIILAGVFIIILPFAGQDYISRMSTITDGISASRSSKARYWGLRHGITMMIKRPILGVGIGCYADAREQYFRYRFWAHNMYGEVIGELGLASLAWFAWIYMIFKRSLLLKRSLSIENNDYDYYNNLINGLQISMFVRLVVGNFSHGAFIWFWFLMAALVIGIENSIKAEVLDFELKGI